jgi:hypothetical protein
MVPTLKHHMLLDIEDLSNSDECVCQKNSARETNLGSFFFCDILERVSCGDVPVFWGCRDGDRAILAAHFDSTSNLAMEATKFVEKEGKCVNGR